MTSEDIPEVRTFVCPGCGKETEEAWYEDPWPHFCDRCLEVTEWEAKDA